MARCRESLPRKKLKWRETKLDKVQPETEELTLSNGSLTQEIVQVESRIQELWEDLAKNEIVHAIMRKNKIGAILPLLGRYKLYYFAEVPKKTKRRQGTATEIIGNRVKCKW